MKIIIDGKTYTEIQNITFEPETDMTGTEVPINQMISDIKTDDEIKVGINAFLYDDSDKLWGKYWIISADRYYDEFVRVEARSILLLLDRVTLPAKMYTGQSASTVVVEIFARVSEIYSGETLYRLDSSFSADTISGFAPEQTARERLQWVCFCIGAYVKTFFNSVAEILPTDETADIIPLQKTYWRPSITYGDYVTAVKVTAYSYTQGTPATTDEWVTPDEETYYIQTKQEFTLSNSGIPITVPDNVIEVSDVTLINTGNVSEILSRLSKYYFKRVEVDADVINNGEYIPGQQYMVYTDEDTLVTGYMRSASFTFGLQAKSKIKIMQSDVVEGAKLTIRYYWSETLIGSNEYYLPDGYIYSIQLPWIDRSFGAHRYIFYPVKETTDGTVQGETTVDEQYLVAIDYSGGIAIIYNADEMKLTDKGILEIS